MAARSLVFLALAASLAAPRAYGQGPYWEHIGLDQTGAVSLLYDADLGANGGLYAATPNGTVYLNDDPAHDDGWVVAWQVQPHPGPVAHQPHFMVKGDNGLIYMETGQGLYEIDPTNLPAQPLMLDAGNYQSVGLDPLGGGIIAWKYTHGPYRFDFLTRQFTPVFAGLVVNGRDEVRTHSTFSPMPSCGGELHAAINDYTFNGTVDGGLWTFDGLTWTQNPQSIEGNFYGLSLGPDCEIFLGKYHSIEVQRQPGLPLESHDPIGGHSQTWAIAVEPDGPESCHLINGNAGFASCLDRPLDQGGSGEAAWVSLAAGMDSSPNPGNYAIGRDNIIYHGKGITGGGVWRSTRAWRGACRQAGGADGDGDGLCGGADNCPDVANVGQEDSDGDGIGDACDVCPDWPDPEQQDSDGDGTGDICEDDWDDLVINEVSYRPLDIAFIELANRSGAPIEIPAGRLLLETFDDLGDLNDDVLLPAAVVPANGRLVVTDRPSIIAMLPGVVHVDRRIGAIDDHGLRLVVVQNGGPWRTLDALSYGAPLVAYDQSAVNLGAPAPVQPADAFFASLSRCAYSGDNATDYRVDSMTPGYGNGCYPDPEGIDVVVNEMDYADKVTGKTRQFAELYTPGGFQWLPSLWVQVLKEPFAGAQGEMVGWYWLMDPADSPLLVNGERIVLGGDDVLLGVPNGVRTVDTGADEWFHGETWGLRIVTVIDGELEVVDSVSFGAAFADPDGVPVHETDPAPLDVAAVSAHSVSRCADGADSNDNDADFTVRLSTLGLANDCP